MEPATIGEYKVDFHIKTERFEGPLDLLLTLIEKRKLFIGDFALAKVADDYIARIQGFERFPIGDVANFLLVASTLVLIKSRAILPELNLSDEEERDIDDLKRRLRMYELFRSLAQEIRAKYGKEIIFERSARPETPIVFAPDERLTRGAIREAIDGVLSALPKKTALPKATVKKVLSIEEMMERIARRVKEALKTNFAQFAQYERGRVPSRDERVTIIVSFLAMLELVKQGIIHVAQSERHGDIDIETHEFATPEYGTSRAAQ